VLTNNDPANTGNFYIDDDVLIAAGITDMTPYAVDPTVTDLLPDFFL
jgi:citronellol/citronellal dehydrogenase